MTVITDEDIQREHPLVTGCRMLEDAKRAGAHPKVVAMLEHRNKVLASDVVTAWKTTEEAFPILEALYPKSSSSDRKDP